MSVQRILLVEDEALGIAPAEAFFDPEYWQEEGSPPELLIAKTGTEFEELLTEHAAQLDAIITDVVLGPGENGVDIYSRVSALAPDVPCIVITGHAPDSVAISALKAGVQDYIRKPFAWTDLWRQLKDKVAIARLERTTKAFREAMLEISGYLQDVEQLSRGELGEQMIRRVLEVAMLATQAHGGWLFLADAEGVLKAEQSVGYPPASVDQPGLFSTVFETGFEQCFFLEGGVKDGLAAFESDKGALLTVPISSEQGRLGVLELARDLGGEPFTAAQVSLLNQFAELAAVVVESRQRDLDASELLVRALRRSVAMDPDQSVQDIDLAFQQVAQQARSLDQASSRSSSHELIELVSRIGAFGPEHLDFWRTTAQNYLRMLEETNP